MKAKTGEVAIADAAGDAGNGQLSRTEKFSGFVEADLLEVGLKTQPVMLTKQTGEIAGTGERDLLRNLGQSQRAVHPKREVGARTLKRVGVLGSGRSGPLRDPIPDGFDMMTRGVLGGGGITQRDGLYEVFMFFGEYPRIGEAFFTAFAVELLQTGPDRMPEFPEQRDIGHGDDGVVQCVIRSAKRRIIETPDGADDLRKRGAHRLQALRLLCDI